NKLATELSDRTLSGRPIELALISAGLAPGLILRGVLDADGRYAAPLGALSFGLTVLDHFPPDLAQEHDLVPLVCHGTTLLALARSVTPPWRQISSRGVTWDVVHVGTSRDPHAALTGLLARAARRRAGHDNFPAYLTRRGLLRGGY